MTGTHSLLIKNIGWLVTMNPERTILRHAYLKARDGWIEALGEGEPPEVEEGAEILDAKGGIALPGMVNTHHHMMQSLARALTPIANLPLYGWLRGLMPIWEDFTPEDLFAATQTAVAELMLTGCTTTVDHHYMFPRGAAAEMIDAQFAAVAPMGIRFHSARGGMDQTSEIMPEWCVQSIDEFMRDAERLTGLYHDPNPGSMARVALAPTALLSCSQDLYRETARFAQERDLGLHTHCGETPDEITRALALHRMRPLDYLTSAGWDTERVWIAHGIHFQDEEVSLIGRQRMGVAHCPCSNMRLGSGICRVLDLRAAGASVGLGVDGSASNDSGHMLGEARQALLLTRVAHGAGSMTVEEALTLATMGGARCLRREAELGSLEVGKCADAAIFPAEDLHSSGAENKVDALLLCFPRRVDALVVHGRVRVRDGELPGAELPTLLERQRASAHRLHG